MGAKAPTPLPGDQGRTVNEGVSRGANTSVEKGISSGYTPPPRPIGQQPAIPPPPPPKKG